MTSTRMQYSNRIIPCEYKLIQENIYTYIFMPTGDSDVKWGPPGAALGDDTEGNADDE